MNSSQQNHHVGGQTMLQPPLRELGALSVLWAVYFCAVLTVAWLTPGKQVIIWGGGVLVAVPTLAVLARRRGAVPREVLLLAGFLGWSLLGGFQVADWQGFLNYFKLGVELLLLVGLVGAVVRIGGRLRLFWWSFLAIAIFNTVAAIARGPLVISAASRVLVGTRGVTDNANAFAFLCLLGVLGALGIIGERVPNWVRAVAVAGAVVATLGIVAAGSRGAYLSLVLGIALWPIMCLKGRSRRRWVPIIATIVIGIVLYAGVEWIQASTNLGMRTASSFARGDRATNDRLQLALMGVKIAAEHPLIGVGLGQFGLVSGTGMYAHNEWAELLSTTGVPGFLLLMGVYWSAWRRLSRALRKARDPIVRYRISFARMTLIILVVAGAVFRPNFTSVDTMFLLAVIVGVSWWAKDQTLRAVDPVDRLRGSVPSHGSSRLPSVRVRPFTAGAARPEADL